MSRLYQDNQKNDRLYQEDVNSIQGETTSIRDAFVALTYLIYIVIWESMIFGGFGYVVFGLGHSGWWMLLAIMLSGAAYRPYMWRELLTGKRGGDNEQQS